MSKYEVSQIAFKEGLRAWRKIGSFEAANPLEAVLCAIETDVVYCDSAFYRVELSGVAELPDKRVEENPSLIYELVYRGKNQYEVFKRRVPRWQ